MLEFVNTGWWRTFAAFTQLFSAGVVVICFLKMIKLQRESFKTFEGFSDKWFNKAMEMMTLIDRLTIDIELLKNEIKRLKDNNGLK